MSDERALPIDAPLQLDLGSLISNIDHVMQLPLLVRKLPLLQLPQETISTRHS